MNFDTRHNTSHFSNHVCEYHGFMFKNDFENVPESSTLSCGGKYLFGNRRNIDFLIQNSGGRLLAIIVYTLFSKFLILKEKYIRLHVSLNII